MQSLFYTDDGPRDAPVVLLVHGITSSHKAWAGVARNLPHHRVIAVDLRGRGASQLGAPYGLEQHATDLIAVLDELDIDRATVAGHSMGAFVAVVLAHLHPKRVTNLLLVDGGIPLELPDGVGLEQALGPTADRLTMEFATREAYREFWARHPSLVDDWGPDVAAFADYDLVERDGVLRSRTSADAMRTDAAELYDSELVVAALDRLRPTTLLTAPRGLLDDAALYAPATLAKWADRVPMLEVMEVPDVNHYTIIMGARGAATVAAAIRAAGR